jgi:peroxiredoxin
VTLSARAPEKQAGPEPAPYFILPTWDGQVIKSTSLKGKVILMAFFQTWCPDCQRTNPLLEKLYRKHKERGLVVLGVSHDRGKARDVEPYVKKYGLTYPIVLGDISVAVNYLRVSPQRPNFSIPYLVLVDRQGNIVGRFVEGRDKETHDMQRLEERITPLLEP